MLMSDLLQSSFAGNALDPTQVNMREGRVWDTITYAAAATVSSANALFFTNITGVGKTIADTNMTRNNQLVNPEILACYSIAIEILQTVKDTDVFNLLSSLAFRLYISKKLQFECPIEELGAGVGPSINIATQTTHNGTPDGTSKVFFEIPFMIVWGNDFQAVLDGAAVTLLAGGGPGGLGLKMRCILRGPLGAGVG